MLTSTNNSEYKKGDMVWVAIRGADQNYGYGEIEEVWYEESIDDVCFIFYDLVNGGTRIGEVKNIIEKAGVRMTAKLEESRRSFAEYLKGKW